MTDVPLTSPERPIILSAGRPATGSRRRPVDFALPAKNRNRCVIQGLLHLKNNSFINHKFLYWSPQSPLKVPCRFRTLGPLGDLQETFLRCRVPAGWLPLIPKVSPSPNTKKLFLRLSV